MTDCLQDFPPCLECNGRGETYNETCLTCGGDGEWVRCEKCSIAKWDLKPE